MNTSIDELLDKEVLLNEIVEVVNNPNLTGYTKAYYLRNVAIQTWTEHYPSKNSKHEGCKYWSVNAYNQKFEPNFTGEKEPFIHEHVIPKDFLIKTIFLGEKSLPVTKDYVEFYLNVFVFGCVVTESESRGIKPKSTMPEEFLMPQHEDYLKLWLRYNNSNVDVYEVEWERENPISKRLLHFNSIKATTSI